MSHYRTTLYSTSTNSDSYFQYYAVRMMASFSELPTRTTGDLHPIKIRDAGEVVSKPAVIVYHIFYRSRRDLSLSEKRTVTSLTYNRSSTSSGCYSVLNAQADGTDDWSHECLFLSYITRKVFTIKKSENTINVVSMLWRREITSTPPSLPDTNESSKC